MRSSSSRSVGRDARSKDTARDARSKDTARDARSKDTARDARSKDTARDARSKDTARDARSKDTARDARSRGPVRRVALPAALVLLALAVGAVFFMPHGQAKRSPTSPTSTVLVDKTSQIPASELAEGKTLFDNNCSSCHGVDAKGGAFAPNLQGVGAGTVDLWVSSGWMPLANPATQPARKPALFDTAQTKAIAEYVQSLAPGGIPIPSVNLKGANQAEGFSVFALNCAPCHTITGAGDALADGITAPPLHGVTATMVAEAVRSGPGNMPRFSSFTISPKQLTDVVSYVTRDVEHPDNRGGLGLGGVGPVAEGFVGLFIGVGLCVLLALWIGDRNEHDEDAGHADGHGGDDHGGDGPHPDKTEPEVVHA